MIVESVMPQVREYTKALECHFNRSKINVDEWIDERLRNPPPITPDMLEYLQALIVLGERDSVEPSGYSAEKMLELAEATGHKKGYLYAITYLVSNCETVKERES